MYNAKRLRIGEPVCNELMRNEGTITADELLASVLPIRVAGKENELPVVINKNKHRVSFHPD